MKKTLTIAAVILIGGSVAFAAEKPAKMYGPVKVYDQITNGSGTWDIATYAMQDKWVLAIYTNGDGDIRFELQSAANNTDLNPDANVSNKKDVSTMNAGSQYLPGGVNTTWDANDVGQIRIVGFKSKSVVVRYRFSGTNVTRFYSYTLSSNAQPKILGSTGNILNANYTDSTSDGKKVWIQADFEDTGTQQFKEFTNRLEGIAITSEKTAKTTYDVGALEDDVILPLIRNQYNYTRTRNVDDGDGDIYDKIVIHK